MFSRKIVFDFIILCIVGIVDIVGIVCRPIVDIVAIVYCNALVIIVHVSGHVPFVTTIIQLLKNPVETNSCATTYVTVDSNRVVLSYQLLCRDMTIAPLHLQRRVQRNNSVTMVSPWQHLHDTVG